MLYRWFWDTGASPAAVVSIISGPQQNLSNGSDGTAETQNAVDQWHGVSDTDIHISGLDLHNETNVQVFLGLAAEYAGVWMTSLPCGSGGIAGVGGPYDTKGQGLAFKGDSTYTAILDGAVETREFTGSPGCYDVKVFRTVILHEFGHVLGLDHPDQAVSRHSTTTSAEWDSAVMFSGLAPELPSTPQTDDIQAMQFYYDIPRLEPIPVHPKEEERTPRDLPPREPK